MKLIGKVDSNRIDKNYPYNCEDTGVNVKVYLEYGWAYVEYKDLNLYFYATKFLRKKKLEKIK